MYNRTLKTYNLFTLGELDDYGMRKPLTDTESTITGSLGLYSHSPVEDVRFNEVQYTMLTKDSLDEGCVIADEDKMYKVVFTNEFGRLNQVFLKEWQK